jgi:hypothetical protein
MPIHSIRPSEHGPVSKLTQGSRRPSLEVGATWHLSQQIGPLVCPLLILFSRFDFCFLFSLVGNFSSMMFKLLK